MRVQFLIDSAQRSYGAMLSAPLTQDLLVFVYPEPAPRLFHTFFCPTLRVIALDDDGKFLFDQVIQPNRFVRLPACKVVLETDPIVDVQPYLESIVSVVAHGFDLPQRGAWDAGVPVDSLVFALLAEAVSDMRRVKDARIRNIRPKTLREQFQVWERGQIASSAGFLLDFSHGWQIPPGALRISRQVLTAEDPHLDELFAASVAGIPWHHEVQRDCLRCGRGGYWHPVLQAPENIPMETAWRYLRPENAVPLCHRCVETLDFLRQPDLRIDLVWGLWGKRFEALWQWHRALEQGCPPAWDKLTHPLWPAEFGGAIWAEGSGALKDAGPRGPEGVQRADAQIEALKRALFSKRMLQRHRDNTPLWRLLESGENTIIPGDNP
jgi:hypothetical protein